MGLRLYKQALADARHEYHEDMLDWLGLDSAEEFDPVACVVVEINDVLGVRIDARR